MTLKAVYGLWVVGVDIIDTNLRVPGCGYLRFIRCNFELVHLGQQVDGHGVIPGITINMSVSLAGLDDW